MLAGIHILKTQVNTEVKCKLSIFSLGSGVDAPSQMHLLKLILVPNLEVDLDALHKTFQLLQ